MVTLKRHLSLKLENSQMPVSIFGYRYRFRIVTVLLDFYVVMNILESHLEVMGLFVFANARILSFHCFFIDRPYPLDSKMSIFRKGMKNGLKRY